jgi:hypothetical protein
MRVHQPVYYFLIATTIVDSDENGSDTNGYCGYKYI